MAGLVGVWLGEFAKMGRGAASAADAGVGRRAQSEGESCKSKVGDGVVQEITTRTRDSSILLSDSEATPALSIGNVGQLAVDLLVSSSRARRVAYLDEPSVLPCAGNDAFGPDAVGDLALALEAYESPSHRLAFIQQRSPIITGMVVSFAKNVANFISSIEKDHVVILSSLDSGKRRIIDASSDMQVYYLSSYNEDGSDPKCENLGWKKLEEYDPSQQRWKCLASLVEGGHLSEDMTGDPEEMTINDYYSSLPFAALFSACKAKGLKVTCVLCYCSEGDNMPESFQLAEAACKLVAQGPEQFHGNGSNGWTIPLSWKSVYGPPPDLSIF
uniref:Proteasome assembly chaperone 2 n=1 Tax=Oryza barthii TaxID=65489 RepID=A0A0D3FPH8_9ORYZ